MTRQALLVVSVILMMRAVAGAQSIEVGVKAGVDWATVSNFTGRIGGLDAGPARNVIGGVYVCVPISGGMAWQQEAMFARKGTTLTASTQDVSVRTAIRLEYLEFPALVRLSPAGLWNGRAYVLVGPSFGYRLRAGETIESFGLGAEADLDPTTLKRFEASLVAGGGVRMGRIAAEGRYSHGLTTVDALGAAVKNRVVAILIGFHF